MRGQSVRRILGTLFRSPIDLETLLENNPALPANLAPSDRRAGVGGSSVVRWEHLWSPSDNNHHRLRPDAGLLPLHWQPLDGPRRRWTDLSLVRMFADVHIIPEWTCDITEITAIHASESDLSIFENLDEFAETRCGELIKDVSIAGLKRNLAHDGIRILNTASHADYLQRWAWDGRLFLMNDGGSHHFAAARWLARKLGVPVPIRSRLRTVSVRRDAVEQLVARYDLFAVNGHQDASFSCALYEALRSSGTPFLLRALPASLGCGEILIFESDDRRSWPVVDALRRHGATCMSPVLEKLSCVPGVEPE
ncbi:MAG: DUF6685 family protein [Dokdonella sp.]